jgi:hypothetical protein
VFDNISWTQGLLIAPWTAILFLHWTQLATHLVGEAFYLFAKHVTQLPHNSSAIITSASRTQST